jgi:hypothetical protein
MIPAILAAMIIATPLAAAEWYEGGTLHQANGQQWRSASDANRLATAGNWVVGMSKQFRTPVNSMSQAKLLSYQLVTCVTNAVSGPGGSNQPVSEMGAACMYTLGWIRQ